MTLDIAKLKKVLKSNNFCMYPFSMLWVLPDGRLKICCKQSQYIEGKNIVNDDLFSIWNSDYLKNIRKSFINGDYPENCDICSLLLSRGISYYQAVLTDTLLNKVTSLLESTELKFDMGSGCISKLPTVLLLSMRRLCNYKCRICSPEYSTSLQKEKGIVCSEISYEERVKVLDKISELLPNISKLMLAGGEPLLIDEYCLLLQECIDKGYNTKIHIIINTNGAVYSEKWVELLNQFKKVTFFVSIDDIEERIEYQRKGLSWEFLLQNIKKYQESFSSNGAVCLSYTVSLYNVYYLPEFLEWYHHYFYNPLEVSINFVENVLSIRNLPDSIKQFVKKRLLSSKYDFVPVDYLRKTKIDIIKCLELPEVVPIQKFWQEVCYFDNIRKENFKEIFPEYWKLLSDYV